MKTELLTYDQIDKVIEVLNNNGLVAFPTDTVFGLACRMDVEAIKKVYEVKGRDFDKPLPVMCDGFDMISKIAYVTKDAKKIMDKFMPGAITLVYKKKEDVDDYITQGKETIGIRVPDDKWILSLIAKLDCPIMVTSANKSNTPSLFKWDDVYKQFDGLVDVIVKDDAKGNKASTIVDVVDDVKILRQGPISFEDIKECLQ